ncbi:hypothetical protein EHP00_2727 [Ecytonucleospora hepatopenaei]|uniref:GOLD domain-containing protein n=1 Tax=Ecytonucleospora hepatopenaei TaxID=646526 RepID=A0A1W0E444_9MICR|nr:hypothetical protein EHP00_514 [Ecytonucleospora hepatopenaei]OQS54694.1 hypothetical protein EHP00_2727 [Ecytonucleospora hepatopenaei]
MLFKFYTLLGIANAEIFEFNDENPLEINFRLEAQNISSGFFVMYDPDHMTEDNIVTSSTSFKVEVAAKNNTKKFFESTINSTEKKHFSFSNTTMENLFVRITPINLHKNNFKRPPMVKMIFETKLNTFDTENAVKHQIEPAVAEFDKLITKLTDIINVSQNASKKTIQLGAEHKRMFGIVVFLSFVGLIAYAIFNIVQVSLMKKYLTEKKYL